MGESEPAQGVRSPHKKSNKNRQAASLQLFQSTMPQTGTSYAEDYGPKSQARTEISLFSAENRRNNPHPREAFISWRLPSNLPPLNEGSSLEKALSAELEETLKRKVKPLSTYQQDYVKEPQILGNLPPINPATNKVHSPSVSPSRRTTGTRSEMCEAYQAPSPTPHLRGNTSRYGCSSNYVKAACGVVPTLHPIVNAPNYQTWYANEFGVGTTGKSRRPPTPIYPLHLPPILRGGEVVTCKSARAPPRRDRAGGKSSLRGPGGLSWLSEWAGPM